MEKEKKEYEKPELVELGPAEVLTMGNRGCAPDGLDCDKWPDPYYQPF